MTESTHQQLLRRKARGQSGVAADEPPTPSRAVRLSLAKAADDAIGLALTVESVAQESGELDAALAGLSDDLMLVALVNEADIVGLIAVDQELRAAVAERQMIGALLDQSPEPRPATGTDKTLCEPLFDRFLEDFPRALQDTPLAGWVDHVSAGDRVVDLRAAGLLLEDRVFRVMRMRVAFGVAEREGQLILMLPVQEAPLPQPVDETSNADWPEAFAEQVYEARAALEVRLAPVRVPLATVQDLKPDMLLPLPGCRLDEVSLMSATGTIVATARLGQAGGMRAVRLQEAAPTELADLVPPAMVPTAPVAAVAGLEESGVAAAVVQPEAPDPMAIEAVPGIGDADDETAEAV